jgi:hypothetical protein
VDHSSSLGSRDQGPTKTGDSSVNGTRFDTNIHSDYTDIQTHCPIGLNVDFGPDDFNAVIFTDIIIGGGKMNFVDGGTETASDLVTLIRGAVDGTPPSLLSRMLPAIFAAEAVLACTLQSAAVALPTTVEGLSPICTASVPSPQCFGKATSTIEQGAGATITSGLYGTHARKSGGVMARLLKSLLPAVLTQKSANGGNHRMMVPPAWSARPMAFARYTRPHGHGVNGVSNEMEKRRHFSGKEAAQKR